MNQKLTTTNSFPNGVKTIFDIDCCYIDSWNEWQIGTFSLVEENPSIIIIQFLFVKISFEIERKEEKVFALQQMRSLKNISLDSLTWIEFIYSWNKYEEILRNECQKRTKKDPTKKICIYSTNLFFLSVISIRRIVFDSNLYYNKLTENSHTCNVRKFNTEILFPAFSSGVGA